MGLQYFKKGPGYIRKTLIVQGSFPLKKKYSSAIPFHGYCIAGIQQSVDSAMVCSICTGLTTDFLQVLADHTISEYLNSKREERSSICACS